MHRRFLAALVSTLLLAACAAQVKEVAPVAALPVPEGAYPAPVMFGKLRPQVPMGALVGTATDWSMLFCLWPHYGQDRSLVGEMLDGPAIRETFYDTFEGLGYDVTGDPALVVDEEFEEDLLRTEYRVSGRLKDVQMRACTRDPGLLWSMITKRYGVRGEMYVQIEWSVYDALRRSTVYKTVTEGYTNRRAHNPEGLPLMFNEAFAMAVHNLGTEPLFSGLIVYGRKPPADSWKSAKADHEPRRKFETLEPVSIAALPLSRAPVPGRAERVSSQTIMIEAGPGGHCSGFFITRQGHILTNRHCVGEALRTRIVTTQKKDSFTAEVLRSDAVRDVALLKAEGLPDDVVIDPLPLRAEWPAVGERIYVVGAPLYKRLQDTLSEGVVSAHRRDFKIFGSRQNFLQADITAHGGNSGGPMVDQYGNLVAMTVGGFTADPDDGDTGLNLFIPIDEALKVLDIDQEDPPHDQPLPLASR